MFVMHEKKLCFEFSFWFVHMPGPVARCQVPDTLGPVSGVAGRLLPPAVGKVCI